MRPRLSLLFLLAACSCHHVGADGLGFGSGGGTGPDLVGLARFLDRNDDGVANAGDWIVVAFDTPVVVNDPSVASLELGVVNDAYGIDAEVVAGPLPHEVHVVLGPGAVVRTRGVFDPTLIGPGVPSGVRVSPTLADDAIENPANGLDARPSAYVDVVAEPVPGTGSGLADTALSAAGGDLDGDGRCDWAAANGELGVDVYRSLPDGGYERTSEPVAGALDLELVDLVGGTGGGGSVDGRPDVLVRTAGDLVVLENLSVPGNVELQAIQTLVIGSAIVAFATIDADGDGDRDVAILTADGVRLAENLEGTLAPPGAPLPTSPTDGLGIAVADVDGNGLEDLVIVGLGPGVWLANLGCKNFAEAVVVTGSGAATAIDLGDVDQDGDVDAVVGGELGAALWRNTGSALSFADELDVAPVRTVLLADLDADSAPELLLGGLEGLRILANDRETPFVDAGMFLPVGATLDVAACDADQDGDLDLFAATEDAPQVWHGSSRGTWGSPRFRQSAEDVGSGHLFAVTTGDVDGDGDPDILTGRNATLEVHFNEGGGAFDPEPGIHDLDGARAHGLALADVDGDGDLDVIAAILGDAPAIWLNDGQGDFSPVGTGGFFERGTSVAAGDLDGDGDVDYVLGRLRGSTDLVIENLGFDCGGGSPEWLGFAEPVELPGVPLTSAVRTGDLDSDGDLDLLFAHGGGESDRIFLNDGTGGFVLSPQDFGASNTRGHAVADFDRDGDLDLVAGKPQSDEVWHNDGGGTFTLVNLLEPDATFDVETADLNGDGLPDLVEGRELFQGIILYFGTPDGAFSAGPRAREVDENVRRIEILDVDNDGAFEFVTGMEDDSPNRLWRNL